MSEYITIKRTELEQALKAIEDLRGYRADIDEAITNLEHALAQQASEPAGRVVSANCEYATVQWLKQTSNVGGGDPKNSRSWPIAGDAVYTAPPQRAEPTLQTCNCRWDGEVQVQQCTLHEAHVDAIHEWAERAKTAEKKLAALAQQAEPVEPVACIDALKDAFFEGFTSVATYNDTLLNSPEEAWEKYKPPHTAPPQRAEPAYYEVSSGVTHNLWMRVSKSQYDEYVRGGWEGRTLHALTQQNITDSNKDN